MGTKSPGGPARCRLILQHCLAIQLTKPGHTPEDFWMYDSGYMIFQNFLAANAQCWWNVPLTAATRALKYAGHVAPGMLLVTAEPCALEVLRSAYARSVLKPPATYVINSVGDIDDCLVQLAQQTQFTPLTEALCDVIMDLTSQGHSATIENIKINLGIRFSHMQQPTVEVIYDTLAQLMQERKIYQTSKGYFIVTPERRRSRSKPRSHRSIDENCDDSLNESMESRTILMTNSEALHSLYGEISTERDGDLTHQCIQTNLADVICGGNPNDKILYPRISKRRSASFPTPRSLERRHSLRLFGSSKRLQRCASTRSLSKNYAQTLATTDSSSSEYQSTDSSSPKKSASLLSRLFRRSGRSKQKQTESFSGQFPPPEWFNSRAVHLHSVGTQTIDHDIPVTHTLSNSTFYDGSEISQRSLTLPRRHHRRHMSSESTFLISSRDCSPIRRRSPACYTTCGSLPRSTHSISASSASGGGGGIAQTRSPKRMPLLNKQLTDEQNHRIVAKSGEIYRNNSAFNSSNSNHNNCSSSNNSNKLDNKLGSGLDQRQQRPVYSGPSSIESGKASSLITSGPSSIDSGKISYSRTSGHSSLESHVSTNTIATTGTPSVTSTSSPQHKANFLYGNGGCGSPKMTPKYQFLHSKGLAKPKAINENKMSAMTSTPSSTPSTVTVIKPRSTTTTTTTTSTSAGANCLPHSMSNNSITLQVTNSSNNIPNTKIFVQNSPAHSVITLENGKLLENSNVYIINNETTTKANGEVINHRKFISRQNSLNKELNVPKEENEMGLMSRSPSETLDTLSMISELNQDVSATPTPTPPSNAKIDNLVENSKFTKNINNDATMNNSRKLSLQLTEQQPQQQGIIFNKNVLKQNSTTPTSPNINNKNLFGYDNNNLHIQNNNLQSQHQALEHQLFNSYEQIAGSVGNLRQYDKFSDMKIKKLNSNCDLKNAQLQFNENNLKNSKTNSESLVNILHKNIQTVGSEPNLAINKIMELKQKITDDKLFNSSSYRNEPHRRLSLTIKDVNEQSTDDLLLQAQQHNDELYNFPSLTDLSFNFQSLAAQKILQGVSINSIDTLVELNINQEKQQNTITSNNNVNVSATTTNTNNSICTDFGLV